MTQHNQVRNQVILDRYTAGEKLESIAQEFEISRQYVHQIVRRAGAPHRRSSRRRWTTDDLAELTSLRKQGHTVRDISQKLQRSRAAVNQQVFNLGIQKGRRRLWTTDELAELKSLRKQGLSAKDISQKLQRSEVAVNQQVFNLGIPKGSTKNMKTKTLKTSGEVFKIERDVPIPLTFSEQMPLEDMEVGDSFFVAVSADDNIKQVKSRIAGSLRKRDVAARFTTRAVEAGVRVWRTE
jgi:biotin operon repressor